MNQASDLEPLHPTDWIAIRGARVHNLRDLSLDIPHNQVTVLTGVSGSGKSSLAFDTLFAEGQRQYIESLSTYARQFLNQLQRPDVDSIDGLQPTLCIDQRAATANPRSTVATVTEVYDYLRLLMARVGTPNCHICDQPIVQQSPQQILKTLLRLPEGTKLVLMSPMVRGRKGAHREVFQKIRKAGLVRVRVDDELLDIESVPELSVRKNHSIDAVVDKIVIRPDASDRLSSSLKVALQLAEGLASVSYLTPAAAQQRGDNQWTEEFFSTLYACPTCGVSLEELEPRTFSFNSPYGACPACEGQGVQTRFNPDFFIANESKPATRGGLAPLKTAPPAQKRKLRTAVERLLSAQGGQADEPLGQLKKRSRQQFLDGIAEWLEELFQKSQASAGAEETLGWLQAYRQSLPCEECGGSRLRKEALAVRLVGKSMHEIVSLSISDAVTWFENLELDPEKQPIARPILSEMLHRLRFLAKVGVSYLTLGRSADTLSGGELQRVRLAASIGSGLVGVCYILDEPSIGLHQRDNDRLIASLRDLQQQGNTVIVVEHDEAMMREADRLVDIGPGAGRQGGQVVALGTPEEVMQHPESLTAAYLRGDRMVSQVNRRRPVQPDNQLRLTGAVLHNLQDVSVDIPLGLLVGVTGVSGSGKSSLIGETLAPALALTLGQATPRGGTYRKLEGSQALDKLIEITQNPIGRTPRSTPATYCGVFDLIRGVWASTRQAKQRGYTASRFSFNAGDGRCGQCQGQGQEKIEMNFLPDLYVTCSVCNGLRYNRQTLQVLYRDRSMADVLAMSVSEAAVFFENFPKIQRLLCSLEQVGLGYLCLGQSSSTLSGGEAQRIKLATELARPETGSTIYFLDEPTTGLHFEDVRRLIGVLGGLVDRGNTVLVIEHNLDVIRACDWLIDMGPEGGDGGGRIVACGTPEEVAQAADSLTGHYLNQFM